MKVAYDYSIELLAQGWDEYKKNKDINFWKIRPSNINEWKVKKCFRKCCIIGNFKKFYERNKYDLLHCISLITK